MIPCFKRVHLKEVEGGYCGVGGSIRGSHWERHILWNKPFQETQQAVGENVLKLAFSLHRRVNKLKAKGLARVGKDEVFFSFLASRQWSEPQEA